MKFFFRGLRHSPEDRDYRKLVVLLFVWLSGCGIWNGYLDPDYSSTRADRICHPYGQCSEGSWVADEGVTEDIAIAHAHCLDEAELSEGNGWWGDSVTRGLVIGECMEKRGFTLQQ